MLVKYFRFSKLRGVENEKKETLQRTAFTSLKYLNNKTRNTNQDLRGIAATNAVKKCAFEKACNNMWSGEIPFIPAIKYRTLQVISRKQTLISLTK